MIKDVLDNEVISSQPASVPVSASVHSQKLGLAAVGLIAGLLVAIVLLLQLRQVDPYVQDVLSLQGDASQGQVIFQMNCATCHGLYGDGVVGPSLHHVSSRKSPTGLIEQVISGKTPPMPQFQPNPQEMADLLSYLETL